MKRAESKQPSLSVPHLWGGASAVRNRFEVRGALCDLSEYMVKHYNARHTLNNE